MRFLLQRRSLIVGLVAALVALAAALPFLPAVSALLVGWDIGVAAYAVRFAVATRNTLFNTATVALGVNTAASLAS